MLVLQIIGFLVLAFISYVVLEKFNNYTDTKYQYRFLDSGSFFSYSISYGLMYWGHNWYEKALSTQGDLLNGQIIMGIAVVIILINIFINFRKTPFHIALIGSVVQLGIYVIGTVIGLFVLLIAIAFFSETKPVYSLN